MNYWEAPDVTKAQLQEWLVEVMSFVQGEEFKVSDIADKNEQELKDAIGFYERVADK